MDKQCMVVHIHMVQLVKRFTMDRWEQSLTTGYTRFTLISSDRLASVTPTITMEWLAHQVIISSKFHLHNTYCLALPTISMRQKVAKHLSMECITLQWARVASKVNPK